MKLRKFRVLIYDDDAANRKLLGHYLAGKDCEVLTFERAVVCPVCGIDGSGSCSGRPCTDVIITDQHMGGMTGTEMIFEHLRRGCTIDLRNVAVMTGDPRGIPAELMKLGCTLFSKPFRGGEFLVWIDECEKRSDRSRPLAVKRTERRHPAGAEVEYSIGADEEVRTGTLVNYSTRGCRLQAAVPFVEGQTITFSAGYPGRATVVWTKQVGPGLFLAGCALRDVR